MVAWSARTTQNWIGASGSCEITASRKVASMSGSASTAGSTRSRRPCCESSSHTSTQPMTGGGKSPHTTTSYCRRQARRYRPSRPAHIMSTAITRSSWMTVTPSVKSSARRASQQRSTTRNPCTGTGISAAARRFGSLDIADRVASGCVSLPIFPEMSDAEVDYVATTAAALLA